MFPFCSFLLDISSPITGATRDVKGFGFVLLLSD